MQLGNVGQQLARIIESSVDAETRTWLEERIHTILAEASPRDMYMTYSLIPSKLSTKQPPIMPTEGELGDYLKAQKANPQQIARIYLLVKVVEGNKELFSPKVANIIQVADTGELETFLKFLILLPDPGDYKSVAVNALRTNVSTVFNAIALNNPYPGLFFDEQQWNQMYLKTAFMQGDLNAIRDIDKRANRELSRIISDYAHERWAASRTIDPYFWRPIAPFLNAVLLADMEHLLASDDLYENRAAVLSCFCAADPEARKLLANHQDLVNQVKNKTLSWNTLKA